MCKPSVCSNSDGVLDIAVDNETAFLFNTKDANDLAEKLEKLILDRKYVENILEQMLEKKLLEKFDLEIVTKQTIKMYNEIVEKEK